MRNLGRDGKANLSGTLAARRPAIAVAWLWVVLGTFAYLAHFAGSVRPILALFGGAALTLAIGFATAALLALACAGAGRAVLAGFGLVGRLEPRLVDPVAFVVGV